MGTNIMYTAAVSEYVAHAKVLTAAVRLAKLNLLNIPNKIMMKSAMTISYCILYSYDTSLQLYFQLLLIMIAIIV
jgi:hypothetical protein